MGDANAAGRPVEQLRSYVRTGVSRRWLWMTVIGCVVGGVTPSASANTHVLVDFEGTACDASVLDGQILEGKLWDTYPGVPQPTVRCGGSPAGDHFVEWHTADRSTSAQVDVSLTEATLAEGSKVYLATFVRFQRVAGADIWRDTAPSPYQFDKLIEFRGTGFRWGIGAGWNGEYTSGGDHQFTFDAWYSRVLIGDHGPDHIVADRAPYGPDHPYLCDYERWYGLVLGVTVASSNAGRVELWIDGTKIIDQAHYTASPSPILETLTMHGTIGQPNYDSPEHRRQLDRLLITDDWADIVAGKYLDGIGTQPPPAEDGGVRDGGSTGSTTSSGGSCSLAQPSSIVTFLVAPALMIARRRRRRDESTQAGPRM